MDASLPNNLPSEPEEPTKERLWQVCWREHLQERVFLKKSKLLSDDERNQKAKLDDEKLQEWRAQLKQIRAKRIDYE